MTIVQVVEEQNTAAIRDLCRALRQHKLLESPHLHVRSLALEVSPRSWIYSNVLHAPLQLCWCCEVSTYARWSLSVSC